MSRRRFPKGSEWRKWDLHVHTPFSVVHNYGPSEAAWENFLADLEALPSDFKVLGINDYIFLDGYTRLLKEKRENGRLANIDLLLPVVEFRIAKFAGVQFGSLKRINLHVIFSDELSPETITAQFLNTIQQSYTLTPGFDPKRWSGAVTRESLEDLGRAIKSTVPPETLPKYDDDLTEGFNNLNVDHEGIFKALQSQYFTGKYLIGIGKTEWAHLKWDDNSISEKKDIINKCHIVFTAAENPEQWRKARESLATQGVNDILLDCSDAHSLSTSSVKDRIGNCNTWIKSNPTFEGLKQVLYEPHSRLAVQVDRPETKRSYEVIDRVRFIDESETRFSSEWIELNPNLNSIIGGKSSGKSLLLYHIAVTANPRITRKLIDSGDPSIKYNYSFPDPFDFEIQWKDGKTSKLSDETDDGNRTITFLPQLYLNSLAEQRSSNSDFARIIEEILTGDESYRQSLSQKRDQIASTKADIHRLLSKFLDIRGKLEKAREELRSLGDKVAIENSIKELQVSLDLLRKESAFTEEEDKLYAQLIVDRDNAQTSLKERQRQIDLNKELCATVTQFKNALQQTIIDPLFADLRARRYTDAESRKTIDETSRSLADAVTPGVDTFLKSLELELAVLSASLPDLEKSDAEITAKISPFEHKMANKEQYSVLNAEIAREKSRLEVIDRKEKEILALELESDSAGIFALYESLMTQYQSIVDVNSTMRKIDTENDISLITELNLDLDRFENNFSVKISKKSNLYTQFGEMFVPGENGFVFTQSAHIDNIRTMFNAIADRDTKVRFNQGFKIDDVLHALLDDYFRIEYDLEQKGDRLLAMSPGKRGIILFQLFLHLSNATTPILIDQPEDNLDNRTVYEELNEFIRCRKLRRQVIAVSHNANLVVSTDSEEIIVANQSGQNKNADNRKFRFEYVSGALEDTFEDTTESGILFQCGIREHVCQILEGGSEAFKKRERKYTGRT